MHRWYADILSKAARVDGAAATRREDIKEKTYEHEKVAGGAAATCHRFLRLWVVGMYSAKIYQEPVRAVPR